MSDDTMGPEGIDFFSMRPALKVALEDRGLLEKTTRALTVAGSLSMALGYLRVKETQEDALLRYAVALATRLTYNENSICVALEKITESLIDLPGIELILAEDHEFLTGPALDFHQRHTEIRAAIATASDAVDRLEATPEATSAGADVTTTVAWQAVSHSWNLVNQPKVSADSVSAFDVVLFQFTSIVSHRLPVNDREQPWAEVADLAVAAAGNDVERMVHFLTNRENFSVAESIGALRDLFLRVRTKTGNSGTIGTVRDAVLRIFTEALGGVNMGTPPTVDEGVTFAQDSVAAIA